MTRNWEKGRFLTKNSVGKALYEIAAYFRCLSTEKILHFKIFDTIFWALPTIHTTEFFLSKIDLFSQNLRSKVLSQNHSFEIENFVKNFGEKSLQGIPYNRKQYCFRCFLLDGIWKYSEKSEDLCFLGEKYSILQKNVVSY